MGAWMLPVHWLPRWRGHDFITSGARPACAAAVLTVQAAWENFGRATCWEDLRKTVDHGTPAKPDRSACRSACRRSSKFCANIARRTMCDRGDCGRAGQRSDSVQLLQQAGSSMSAGRLDSGGARWPRRSALSRLHRARRCCFAPIPGQPTHRTHSPAHACWTRDRPWNTQSARGQTRPTEDSRV